MFPNPTQLAFVTSPENAKIFQDKCEPGNPLITVIFPDTYRYGFFKAQIRLKLSDTLVVKNLNYSPHENSNQFSFYLYFKNFQSSIIFCSNVNLQQCIGYLENILHAVGGRLFLMNGWQVSFEC